jgi:Recombination endonuclease VII
MKKCNKCNLTKSETEFHKQKDKGDGLFYCCKQCRTKYDHKHHQSKSDYYKNVVKNFLVKNKDYNKTYWINYKRPVHGINKDKYLEMFEQQKGVCAVCGYPETSKTKSGKIKRLAVDHCHATGKVRGLLCHRCNISIGMLREDVELLYKVINYIKLHH